MLTGPPGVGTSTWPADNRLRERHRQRETNVLTVAMKMAMLGDVNLDQGVARRAAVAAGSPEAAQAKHLPVCCPRRNLDVERAAIGQRQSTRRAVHGVEKGRRQGVMLVPTVTWATVVRLSPLAEHRVEDVAEVGVAPSARLRSRFGCIGGQTHLPRGRDTTPVEPALVRMRRSRRDRTFPAFRDPTESNWRRIQL